MIVKRISTDHLFKLGERLQNNPKVLGDYPWELIEVPSRDGNRIAVGYMELAEKYFAEVEE